MILPRTTTVPIPEHMFQAAIRRLRVAEWLAGDTRSRATIHDLREEGFEVVTKSDGQPVRPAAGEADTKESVA